MPDNMTDNSPGALTTTLAGETVVLLPDRALYWPARRQLLIADLHLGKADTFRASGIALPRGGTAHDLDRITALLAATRAESLIVLGDLLHGALLDTHWRGSWEAWRVRHGALDIGIVAGNHDRALHRAALEVTLLGDVVDDGPFRLCHEPPDVAAAGRHVLCGHVHPVVRLPGLGRRLPVFWLRDGVTVLPAFSAFTGGVAVSMTQAGTRVVACAGDETIELPPT